MGFIGDSYYYSISQIRSLLGRYWMYDPFDFDEAEGRADIKMALEYYGFKEEDCINISRKKIRGIVCYRTKVISRAVNLIAEYLNGNLWFLNKKSSTLENYLQLDLAVERELISVGS